MEEKTFAQIGRIEAIRSLFEGTPYKAFEDLWFETEPKEVVTNFSRMFLEGIDFNLVYFPLKHLGYKSVVAVTGELYAEMLRPETLSVVLGVSAKLDYTQIKELWGGIVTAAKEHGYKKLALDLIPSKNGLSISVSAVGRVQPATCASRPGAQSKDLICVSGRLGAAYLGQMLLEKEDVDSFEKNRMILGAYLKPEIPANAVSRMEEAGITPSMGYFITRGLSDAVLRLSRDSGLGAKIYADKIPFEGNSFALGKTLDIDPVSAAMNGGDDYQLLFTIPILQVEKFRKEFPTFNIIGHLALKEVGSVLVLPTGVELPLSAQGWNVSEEL